VRRAIRGLFVLIALTAALVPARPANASDCPYAITSDGNLYISGNGTAQYFYIRQNSSNYIECRIGGSGNYGSLAYAPNITRIDINTGGGGDTLYVGDASTSGAATITPFLFVQMDGGGSQLHFQDQGEQFNRNISVGDDFVGGLGTIKRFAGVNNLWVYGPAKSPSSVTVYEPMSTGVLAYSYSDNDTFAVVGSGYNDTLKLTDTPSVTWNGQHTARGGGFEAIVVDGSSGNDTIKVKSEASGIKYTLSGGNGIDKITGGPKGETINGGEKADTLNGGPGRDTINGDLGTDTCIGGDGTDTFSTCENVTQ
jgi:Ca2+-binding RTX toxin-like protein